MGDFNSYFIVPLIAKDIVLGMTDSEAGKLLKALFLYAESGTTDFVKDPVIRTVFQLCKTSIDKARENYIAKCEQNRVNALSRGKNTTVSDGKRPQAMESDGKRPQATASDCQRNKYNNNNNKKKESKERGETSLRSLEFSCENSRPPAIINGISVTDDDLSVVMEIWNTNCGFFPKIRSVCELTHDGANRKDKVIASLQYISGLTNKCTKQEVFDLLAKLIKCADSHDYYFDMDFDKFMREETLVKLYDICYSEGKL